MPAAFVAIAVFAQPAPAPDTSPAARQVMAEALGRISQHPQATIEVNGWVTVGRTQQPMRVVSAVWIDATPGVNRPYFEQNTYVAGALDSRIVGDGATIWAYWPARNVYSSTAYGSAQGDQGVPALRRMLLMADRWTMADASFGIRLLTEAYTSGSALSATWSPWNSGGRLSMVGDEVVSAGSTPAPSSLRYRIGYDSMGAYLQNASFERVQWSGDFEDRRAWTASVFHAQAPADFSASFIPPRGAQALAITSNRGG
jgi:hypothetical protein